MIIVIKDRNGISCDYYEGLPKNLEQINSSQAHFILCMVAPSDISSVHWLQAHCFYLTDLRLECRIKMRELPDKPKRNRFEIKVIEDRKFFDKDELCMIYHEAFVSDRRFHLKEQYDQVLANRIIDSYIKEATDLKFPLVQCLYKEQIIGCAFMQPVQDGFYIYLAGVLPKYQGSGAAVALYRACVDYSLEHEARIIHGRISASNTGVMNLYANLNANFYNPKYLYIYERREC